MNTEEMKNQGGDIQNARVANKGCERREHPTTDITGRAGKTTAHHSES
jgi:hypothetical protein